MELKILLSVWLILGLELCSLCRTLSVTSDDTARQNSKFFEQKSDSVYAAPSRHFMGVFNGVENYEEGYLEFATNAGIISNIVRNEEWFNGTGNVTISEGIGSGEVTIRYYVPLGVSLTIDVVVFTDGDSKNVDERMCANLLEFSRNALKHMKEINDDIGMQLMVVSFFESVSGTLFETYGFGSNYQAKDCFGSTFWYNVEGMRELNGGIGETSFDVVFIVDSGIRTANMYSCVFFNNKYSSRKGRSYQEEFRAQIPAVVDEVGFAYETYGSIYPEGDTFDVRETVNGVIQTCEYGSTWKDGGGTMSVIGGGVGSNYTVYQIKKSVGSYGFYENKYTVIGEQELINH
ncbi:uncharacterized protein [Periplaneta americana]|uniref:uncharacterized protein isoform X1 n=1 Tax=Periplaneta americana TaxID=6978 RepID=UPI0037E8BF91